ncbi:MAG: chemotaxis protein CheW [Gammaproteobacteria bacterium]|nr:chemotaxis protein CheW [Gammaproteobacteria bacterium]
MESRALYKAMLDARDLLDAGNTGKQVKTGERCIAFRVGDECYAIELVVVKEVITPPPIVPVPGAPPEVLGVINLRGSVVTVINSRRVLSLDGVPTGAQARVLVLDEDGQEVGVLVDSVDDILHVDVDALDPVPAEGSGATTTHVRGAVNIGDEIAFLLHRSGLTRLAA